jgi:hypothetical protein
MPPSCSQPHAVLPCRLTEEGEFWEADEEDVTLERECSTPFFVTPYQGERRGLGCLCALGTRTDTTDACCQQQHLLAGSRHGS